MSDAEPALRDADVILLQEMDASSTQQVANALGFWYVYYPAILSLRTQRDFGNAVLSRWPIVEDKKIVLPHVSRYAGTQRTATAATIRIGRGPHTTRGARWDHIFFKGLTTSSVAAAGTVRDVRGASDHRPVWAIAIFGGQTTQRSLTNSRQDKPQ